MIKVGNQSIGSAILGCILFCLFLNYAEGNALVFLKDINTNPSNSSPRFFFTHNGVVIFQASDRIVGNELWRTDGTTEGTWLLKDVFEGEKDGVSLFNSGISLGSHFFFQGTTAKEGNELWKTDGTTEGTMMVKEIFVGGEDPGGGSPPVSLLGSLSNEVYISAATNENGFELWKSDGTESGTLLVKNIFEDLGPNFVGSSRPGPTAELNAKLYFAATSRNEGRELWVTDGTESGTTLVKNIASAGSSSNPENMIAYNGNLIFAAQDDSNGNELWISDGTEAGSQLLKDINDGTANANYNPQNFIQYDGKLYFAALKQANGLELWRTDGTGAGTILFADINPTGSMSGSSSPEDFVEFDNQLFFTANDGVNGREIWVTDGSNTNIFSSFVSGEPHSLTSDGNHLYFTVDTAGNGPEPWISDGTQLGTQLLANLLPGDLGLDPESYVPLNGSVIIGNFPTGSDAVSALGLREPWITDGTTLGTQVLKDIATATVSSRPANFTAFKDMLFFVALSSDNGSELWKSNGSPSGTTMVKDIAPGLTSGDPRLLTPIGDRLFFVHGSPTGVCCNSFLAVTDGNESGTLTLKEFSNISQFISLDGSSIYFLAADLTNDIGLWTSDGTVPGTQLVSDLSSTLFDFDDIVTVGGNIYFSANDAGGANSLWKSDGTDSGTNPLVAPGSLGNQSPQNFIVFNNSLFFSAGDNSGSAGLWQSDGTALGTTLVKSDFGFIYDESLRTTKDKLFFIASATPFGEELWVSDGTTDGTQMVADLDPDPQDGIILSNANDIQAGLDRIYMIIDEGIHGQEIWTSDGTPEGTVLLKDINNRSEGSDVDDLTVVGNTAYFEADDDIHGEELWVSYGTPATTYMLKDTIPGVLGGDPDDILVIGDKVFFELEDGVHGDEVWVLNLSPVCAAIESVNGNVFPVCF